MKVKVQWIIDGVMEVDAVSNKAAEALVDEKLRDFIVANAELSSREISARFLVSF